MVNAEEVVIDIIANNRASNVLKKVKEDLEALQKFTSTIGSSVNIPSVKNGNVASSIAYDFNRVREQISSAQKSLDDFGKSSSKSTPPSLDDALKQLEKIRNIAKDNIKVNIDSGNVKSVTEDVHKLNMWAEKMKSSFAGVKTKDFQLVGSPYNPSNFTMLDGGSVTREAPSMKGELVPYKGTGEIVKSNNELLDLSKEKTLNFAKASQEAGKLSYSSFHQLNNMLIVVGGAIQDMGTKIAGIFGAAGLSGMIQKMWQGAAQRQQNMMYLTHQKGVEEANKYYDEIMDIVTRLPGDDTFLTNILNMASALDKSLKLDNLKEAGTAITDYYMAATMKGENAYETQKDIRKYITTGDTRGMRNSVLASEIESLKNRNSVLERTEALQKALEKTGFSGMSEYESALNQFEELKGHFQKAFADLGGIVLAITQPLMKIYNMMDSIFGSRISQMIIILATALVGLFTVIGGGLIMASTSFRMIETITLAFEALNVVLDANITKHGLFNSLLVMSVGTEKAEAIATDGNVAAKMRETLATTKNNIAKSLGIAITEGETVSTWQLVGATLRLIGVRIINIATTLKSILMIIPHIFWTWRNTDATLSEAIAMETNTVAENSNTFARLMNTLAKSKELIRTLMVVGAIILSTIMEWTNTTSVFANSYAHLTNATMKIVETEATYGLATAVGILDILLAPEIAIILAIVGAIMALVIIVEKLGEVFGFWEDFGSMFGAISDGINSLWEAFKNSDVVQGIVSYFQKFVYVVQYLFESISRMYSKLFGWSDDTGTFDVVQSIVDIFGRLGEVVKWVWNILDDWSNSPLGIITWLNPLGILIFHLDEIGSLFEDIGDAVNRFTKTSEFQALSDALGEVWGELQEPFQELWTLINEIIASITELFSDPEGQGTEERINALVEIFKFLANIIRFIVIPAIRAMAVVLKVILTPIKIVFMAIKGVLDLVKATSDAIKNSFIGKALGWDKDNTDDDKNNSLSSNANYMRNIDRQGLTTNNVNNVRNLGRTYNSQNNQRNVIINQNFSEGSMPIDARNMTKKEARKMFIGAFGYNRSVGRNGILR